MSLEEIRQTEWYQNLQADRESLVELGHQIVKLAGHLNAAQYRFLVLLAEWDRRKGLRRSAKAGQLCSTELGQSGYTIARTIVRTG